MEYVSVVIGLVIFFAVVYAVKQRGRAKMGGGDGAPGNDVPKSGEK